MNDFLESYVPSITERNYLQEIGHVFRDAEKAWIIFRSLVPYAKKHADLKEIAETTTDQELKEQILERIEYDLAVMAKFRVPDGCIYTGKRNGINVPDYDFFYATSEYAYEHTKDLLDDFTIVKHQVLGETVERNDAFWNNMFLSLTLESSVGFDYSPFGGMSGIRYNRLEEPVWCWSYEMPFDQIAKMENQDGKRFEYLKFYIPHPFKPGDHVRTIGKYGRLSGFVDDNTDQKKDYDQGIRICAVNEKGEKIQDSTTLVNPLILGYFDVDNLSHSKEQIHKAIAQTTDQRIQKVLCDMKTDEISAFYIVAPQNVKEKIETNISKRLCRMMHEEIEEKTDQETDSEALRNAYEDIDAYVDYLNECHLTEDELKESKTFGDRLLQTENEKILRWTQYCSNDELSVLLKMMDEKVIDRVISVLPERYGIMLREDIEYVELESPKKRRELFERVSGKLDII